MINGPFRVLDDFEAVDASTEAMKLRQPDAGEEHAFATAALSLRYGGSEEQPSAPVMAGQLVEARRREDEGHSLWATFQRVQENLLRGSQPGRSTQGRRIRTRPVGSIDRNVDLNRALWVLAEEMRKLRHCAHRDEIQLNFIARRGFARLDDRAGFLPRTKRARRLRRLALTRRSPSRALGPDIATPSSPRVEVRGIGDEDARSGEPQRGRRQVGSGHAPVALLRAAQAPRSRD